MNEEYPDIQQFRIWSPKQRQYWHSGGTPMMISGFFRDSARFHVGAKMPYERMSAVKDKNGEDIYEFDICRYTDYDGKVYIQEMHSLDNYHFWGHVADNLAHLDEGEENPYELIGNVRQNPELLEQVDG